MRKFIKSLLVICAVGLAAPAAAQTVGYADAIKILGASCGNDINKYCKNVNIGSNRIQECLIKNSAKLTNKCKTDYVLVYVLLEKRFRAQQAVARICDRDIQTRCKLVKPGRGNVLKCMLKAEKSVGKVCNQAITDAGYR